MGRQGDPTWKVYDHYLGETDDARYTAATPHADSSVYRIDKRSRRRKFLGKRSDPAVAAQLASVGIASDA
jgi:hypothetical protein